MRIMWRIIGRDDAMRVDALNALNQDSGEQFHWLVREELDEVEMIELFDAESDDEEIRRWVRSHDPERQVRAALRAALHEPTTLLAAARRMVQSQRLRLDLQRARMSAEDRRI
jgi:hypothetical protein